MFSSVVVRSFDRSTDTNNSNTIGVLFSQINTHIYINLYTQCNRWTTYSYRMYDINNESPISHDMVSEPYDIR